MGVLLTELNRRIFTSIVLLTISVLAVYSKFLLFFVLIFCFYQVFFEFFCLFKNILKNNKSKLFIILIFILLLLGYSLLFIWTSLNSDNSFNSIYLFFLIMISISTDIGGYIFGKLFKGKKLITISPNKTYSGMIGSFITSILVVYLIFMDYFDNVILLILIILISAASQIGDIFISYIKRLSNVKDTGILLPGHGGLLDRFDGIIFAIILGSIIKIFI